MLVDSVPLIERVIRDALENHGLRLKRSEEWPFHGLSNAHIVDEVTTRWGLTLPMDFSDAVNRKAWDVMEGELQAVSGVADVVHLIHESGTAICVASSGSLGAVEHRLRLTGLYQWFEGRLFGATDSVRPKPHPDVFLRAAETMGYQPSQCVVIEDSVPGIKAGQAARMQVLAFTLRQDSIEVTGVTRFADITSLPTLLGPA